MNQRLVEILRRASELGMTQTDLCRRAEIQNSVLTRWKQGRDPRLSTGEALEEALDATQEV